MNCKPLAACYGRLTVLYRDGSRHVYAICSCGSGPKRYIADALRSGNTQSCGCLARERQSAVGKASATHGMTKTSEYKSWIGMRQRCSDPSDKSYGAYGGRGIKVCARWDSFENFYADMGKRPSKTHSIDRTNNDGDYEPGNCRWATKVEQTRNRRNAKNVTFGDRTLPLQDWCRLYDADYSTVHSRLFKHAWPLELALFAPKHFRLEFWRPVGWVADDFPPTDAMVKELFSPSPAKESEKVGHE